MNTERMSLDHAMPDETLEEVIQAAIKSYRSHIHSIRGQQISPSDSYESHVAWVAWTKAQERSKQEIDGLAKEVERLRSPIRTSEAIDWSLTADEISKQYRAMAIELESAKELLKAWTMPVPSQVPDEWRLTMQDLVAELEGIFCPADMCAKSGVCCKDYAKQSVAEAKALLQSIQPKRIITNKSEDYE